MSVFPERPGRVLPAPVGLTAEFYSRAARGELSFQRCDACRVARHPPRFRCAACGSKEWSWARSSGRGTVFSWTVTHQAIDPAFANEVPYAVLVVEMDEGVRVVGNLLAAPPSILRLDLPVEVVIEPVRDDVALVHFRPVA